MTYNLFLDDIREPYDNRGWIIVRSFDDAVNYIKENGMPKFISFDHDLGENIPTGKDLAQWIVDQDLDGLFKLPPDFDFHVHSANPVGAANINGLLYGYLIYKKEATVEE